MIEDGEIGEVVSISQTENVGYWHQAHSFVRGNWRNAEETSPMILQKCCHDLDIIKWLIDRDCQKVSSFGSLMYFNKAHKPIGSADYCGDCKIDCVYNASDFYKTHPNWLSYISVDGDVDKIMSDKTNPFTRCVYSCDNNVVDHQVVNMLFDGGATAQLTMTAFSKDCWRALQIHGTKGEIIADNLKEIIELTKYGKGGIAPYTTVVNITALAPDLSGHGGGDNKLLEDFVSHVTSNQKSTSLTDISFSLESHYMAFKAEESRLKNGESLDI